MAPKAAENGQKQRRIPCPFWTISRPPSAQSLLRFSWSTACERCGDVGRFASTRELGRNPLARPTGPGESGAVRRSVDAGVAEPGTGDVQLSLFIVGAPIELAVAHATVVERQPER